MTNITPTDQIVQHLCRSCQVLSVDPSFLQASLVILPLLVAAGLFALIVTVVRWFVYINGVDLNLISAEESRCVRMHHL